MKLLLLGLLAAAPARAAFTPSTHLAFDRSPQALSEHCARAKARAETRLKELASLPRASRTFANTPQALDTILWDLGDETASDTFLKYVSVSSGARDAANECETLLGQFSVEVFSREDLYSAVKDFSDAKPALSGEDARLLEKELLDFKRSGLALPRDQRAKVKALRNKIVRVQSDFGKNLNEYKASILLSSAELAGLPADFVAALPREGALYKISPDYPVYIGFMENASDPEARRKVEVLFDDRAAAENVPLFEEALALREEVAKLLGYENHAAFVVEEQMARKPETVERFLARLIDALKPLGQREIADMAALKDLELGSKSDHQIHLWDWRYYNNQLIKARSADKEKVKEYFPLDTVNNGMFAVYEKLLGVKFRKIDDLAAAASWHADAALYEISDAASGEVIAYFYMDLFPREGKYKHIAAAFDIVHARRLGDGSYQKPVSVLVANFAKPSPGRPSLLKHGVHEDVETLFHEFGHIMHQTLTKAHHGRFAGSNVARDFVEAPSQMLENWVWDPEILISLSGRYDDPKQKLPPDLLEKLLAAKRINVGLLNLRQLLFGSVDLAYHTRPEIKDTTAVWKELAPKVMLIPVIDGTHPEAGFGHLMGGYDAGYYGYMWSNVYAQDMFSVFEREGLLNPAIGRRYREEILEPGSSREEGASLRGFLGREPDEQAFLRHLGLRAP